MQHYVIQARPILHLLHNAALCNTCKTYITVTATHEFSVTFSTDIALAHIRAPYTELTWYLLCNIPHYMQEATATSTQLQN